MRILFGLALCWQLTAAPINVKTVSGAQGNGTADDTAAIRSALNSGDPFFPAGKYRITSAINVPAGKILQGMAGAMLTGALGGPLLQASNNNTIDGLTFDGGGVNFPAKADNVKITNNRFQNIVAANAYSMDGITMPGGLTNSTISGNSFVNIYQTGRIGAWSEVCGAIWVWDPVNVAINDNRFDKTCQAIHVTTNQPLSSNLSVLRNTITGSARHNIEIQGKPIVGLLVSNNHISAPQPGINGQMFISVAVGGTGHQILNNTLLGPNQVNPAPHQSAAIESMGTGFLIAGNVAGHFDVAQLVGWSDATWTTRDNIWCDITSAAISIEEGGKPQAVNTNNALTTSCANVVFPPSSTGGGPVVTPPNAATPTGVSAVNVAAAATPTAQVSWTGREVSTTIPIVSYIVKAWATGDPTLGILTAAVPASPIAGVQNIFTFNKTDDGKPLNDGWQYSFAIAAIDAAGVSSPLSATATVQVRLAVVAPPAIVVPPMVVPVLVYCTGTVPGTLTCVVKP